MRAEAGKTYAIIANGYVTQLFDSTIYEEWDETSINVIEITDEMKEWVSVGMRANNDGGLTEPSLEESKQMHVALLESFFLQECQALDGNATQEEKETYSLQLQEAKTYIAEGNANNTPLLKELAKARGRTLKELANKIIENNQAYNADKIKLLAYFQKLKDQVKKAGDLETLMTITYTSPLKKEPSEGQA